MREKEVFLFDQKDMKEILIQMLNIFVLSMVLYVMIITRASIWVIGPIIIVIIVVGVMLTITIMNSSYYRKNSKRVILRCYRWDSYTEGTDMPRIYSDQKVYVELVADQLTYSNFLEQYNTEKKIKKLVYRSFHSFITEKDREVS